VMDRPRFIVSSVTGCAIRPQAARAGSSRPLPTSYYVLDRAFCHRTVAAFDAPEIGGYTFGGNDGRSRLAEAKAAELNAWDAEA
jgi:hypothetical protein